MSIHAMYGSSTIRQNFTVADLPPAGAARVQFFNAQATAADSVVVSMNARGIELVCEFTDAGFTFDLTLSTVVGVTTTAIITFTGVSLANSQDLFAGNYEFIDLDGAPLKLTIANVVNPNSGSVSIFARTTR